MELAVSAGAEAEKMMTETVGIQDSPAEITSLAMQNKSGIILAVFGAVLGVLTSNPWLAVPGLLSGFALGNFCLDGEGAVFRGFISDRHSERGCDAGIVIPNHTVAQQLATPTLPVDEVRCDHDFSRDNKTLASVPKPARTVQRRR